MGGATMATAFSITTAEELLHSPELGRCELVRGDLVMMSPAGFEHGRITSRIGYRVERFVEQHELGVVTGAETGFHIARRPDTVRAGRWLCEKGAGAGGDHPGILRWSAGPSR